MNPRVRMAVLAVVAVAVGILVWRTWGPRADDVEQLSGYVEGDDLYLSSPAAGTVGAVLVAKGQRVEAGAPLFAMDPATLSAQQGQAQARLQQTRSQIAAAEAQARQARSGVAAARASEVGAQQDYQRLAGLQRFSPQAVAALQVDQARAAAAAATAQRQAAEQAAAAAEVQASAARATALQADAALQESGVRLGQLAQRAPAAGRVQEVFFQQGEWAAANQPVVSILPDRQLKLRFFAPETNLSAYQPGRTVRFACDGCAAGLNARITSVSRRPEFTPPVIYSRKTRAKLVFLVEAVPLRAEGLAPGQPVDVAALPGPGERRR